MLANEDIICLPEAAEPRTALQGARSAARAAVSGLRGAAAASADGLNRGSAAAENIGAAVLESSGNVSANLAALSQGIKVRLHADEAQQAATATNSASEDSSHVEELPPRSAGLGAWQAAKSKLSALSRIANPLHRGGSNEDGHAERAADTTDAAVEPGGKQLMEQLRALAEAGLSGLKRQASAMARGATGAGVSLSERAVAAARELAGRAAPAALGSGSVASQRPPEDANLLESGNVASPGPSTTPCNAAAV